MESKNESVEYKYANQLLELLDDEESEVKGKIMSVEVKLRQLEAEIKRIREERKSILRDLCEWESSQAVENPLGYTTPIIKMYVNEEEL